MPIPHECGIPGTAVRWRIPCCTMSKHVKILYHLITVKVCVYLTKSASNVPKCNAILQSCRKHSTPEWIQYITLPIQILNMLILGEIPITPFGADSDEKHVMSFFMASVELFKFECPLDFNYRVNAFYGKVHAT